ncbi:hypothetical protein [Neisseria chenwenguii]|uniref:Uncharacterized protein n=1 Tax=Neisseria chenwenguii TaxID=1853278 RepID=A0A220S3Q0_9NEIS|nr:hypothetical protein [Neisseria chenwenguii]ASK28022.1 hypothetical protein BG910_10040 [Neisseria chenwenguii]ROV57173.1 hypothetical protein EGS38_00300 [Neisseria chenwenguii]
MKHILITVATALILTACSDTMDGLRMDTDRNTDRAGERIEHGLDKAGDGIKRKGHEIGDRIDSIRNRL